MKNLSKLLGVIAIVAVIGVSLVSCGDGNSGNNSSSSSSSSGGSSSSSDYENTGVGGGSDNSDNSDNTGGETGGNTDSNTGGNTTTNTFTPPTKAQVEQFLESHRTNPANQIAGSNAAVYIKSIAVNTYTIGGSNITSNPSAVPEDADVRVKFTLRTNLGFDNLTMGERLNIDNYRVDLMSALQSWLKSQGFKSVPSGNITTGNTIFG